MNARLISSSIWFSKYIFKCYISILSQHLLSYIVLLVHSNKEIKLFGCNIFELISARVQEFIFYVHQLFMVIKKLLLDFPNFLEEFSKAILHWYIHSKSTFYLQQFSIECVHDSNGRSFSLYYMLECLVVPINNFVELINVTYMYVICMYIHNKLALIKHQM